MIWSGIPLARSSDTVVCRASCRVRTRTPAFLATSRPTFEMPGPATSLRRLPQSTLRPLPRHRWGRLSDRRAPGCSVTCSETRTLVALLTRSGSGVARVAASGPGADGRSPERVLRPRPRRGTVVATPGAAATCSWAPSAFCEHAESPVKRRSGCSPDRPRRRRRPFGCRGAYRPLAAEDVRPLPADGSYGSEWSKPAYSSDETRCRGFRPAEAGEGACGPLRSPRGVA